MAVNAEVQRLPSINHRAYFGKKLEVVLAMMNKAGVERKERKANFVAQIAFLRRQVEFWKRSPHHVFQQVGLFGSFSTLDYNLAFIKSGFRVEL